MAIRSEKLDLRLTPEAKRTLFAAAEAARRSVSEFVLESALTRAEETLAGGGQSRARGAPVEELGAERRLQRRDAPARGGVVEMETPRSRDKLPRARDSEKDPDVVPVHAEPLAQNCAMDARFRRLLCRNA